MHSAAYYVGAIIISAVFIQASGLDPIVALYGQMIEVPCSNGAVMLENPQLVKWKYDEDDGSPGAILTKGRDPEDVKILATNSYKDRASIAANASLLIAGATLEDEKVFTCMVVTSTDIKEFPVSVEVHKRPLPPQIKDKVKELENDKLTTLGECIAQDAHPPAEVVWSKNGLPLVDDGKTIIITVEKTKDPATGLSSTSSKLQYAAAKADVDSEFTCTVKHVLGANQTSEPLTFSIHYPTERVELEVISNGPIKEGDNVTLKCSADGNPPPTRFNFLLKDQKVTVDDSDTHTLLAVTRDTTGEYKCSLADDDNLQDAKNVTVNFLDISLDPSGKIVRTVGESLAVTVQMNSSGDVKVSWTKDKDKLVQQPKFDSLKYSDAGAYVCEFSTAGIKQSRSFQLVVQGQPTIMKISKARSEDGQHKVLTCEAEGSPEPSVQWSINGTNEQSSYENGKLTHKITVVPTGNLTVSCMVSNELGEDVKYIDVSSLFEDDEKNGKGKAEEGDDQAKLIVGIVIGLILAAAVMGLVYWVYMKKSRQGSWKTGEKESGTSEESKKLEENNHKAEV
ncbi:CD166 antigen homolog A isoform X1 [Anguilla rostrata]|uniref:CD166 antigen homolog A isoform X1 n=2 Tax=Anguilla rostrata TaxID=7938 RepID=UPI0030D45118